MLRCPLSFPLSKSYGARPTRAAICLRLIFPSSGNRAMSVKASTGYARCASRARRFRRLLYRPPPIADPLKLSQTTNVPTRFRRVSDLGRLTNRFFLKDRCALPDQMSFSLARSWRAFVLAKEDRRGANKNAITIFVFSITAKDFSHGVLLDGKGAILFVSQA